MGIFDKVKARMNKDGAGGGGGGGQSTFSAPPPSEDQQLEQNLIRYRKQRGVNLGAWFSTERWIAEAPFEQAAQPGQSDLDIANGSNAKTILERHWDSWITDDDWKWIVDHGYNTVRLPIGYYHLAGLDRGILTKTAFEPHAETFEGAWSRIQRAIDTAGSHGLGILIDLHGVSGAQNGDAHSGVSSGKIEFWDSKRNEESTQKALAALAGYLKGVKHCVGLELMNEPQQHGKLKGWYERTIAEVQQVAGAHFPIYIGDAWMTDEYTKFAGSQNGFVVVDTHVYRCFTDEDAHTPADGLAQKMQQEFSGQLSGHSGNCDGAIVVGEFSAALNPGSLSGNDGEKDAQRRAFLQAELGVFEEHCAGWFYWTLKKGDGWDAGWSAMNATQAEILPANVQGRKPDQNAGDGDKERRLNEAYDSHVGYWDQHKGHYEHDRFAAGLEQGWKDAMLFHQQGWELGFVGPWAKVRLQDHIRERGDGEARWEYVHGFKQGVKACGEGMYA